ncbi:MAG: carboxypeptidase regulatory-like domain-containing protein [Gemmatimonadota bacterium]
MRAAPTVAPAAGPAVPPRRPHRSFSLAWPVSFWLLILTLWTPPTTDAQDGTAVRGRVFSEATGDPLPNAMVEVVRADWNGATATGPDGAYLFSDVPAGRSLLRVRHIGHQALEMEIVVAQGRTVGIDVLLPVRPVALDPVRVDGSAPSAEADAVAADRAELGIVEAHALESTPGLTELGFADAIRGVPGQEPPDPGSVLYVRGAATDLKLVYLDGAPVYAPFPLGGLIEPFAPELLHQADIYLGGAPARYDGGLSYVMDLRTRGGMVGGARTSGSVDLLSARVLAEAGYGDRLRVIGTARGMHPVAASALLGADLPYEYREGVLRGDARLGETTFVSFTGFGNGESVRIGSSTATDTVIEWGNRAGSVRLRGSIGRTDGELTAAVGGYSAELPLAGTRPLRATGEAKRTRLAADLARAYEGWQLRYGGSLERQEHTATARPLAEDGVISVIDAEGSVFGVYGEASAQVASRVSLRAGMRLDQFSGGGGLKLGPRVAATWFVTDRAALTLAAGGYHQFVRPPDEVLLRAPESADLHQSPSLTVGRASHFTIGLDQEIGEGVRLGVEGFFKDFADVPGGRSTDANASGVDLWVRRGSGAWTGWLGYSLAWVWSPMSPEQQSNFTGRHLLSAGLGAPIRERTRLDLRFAYGAGLPYSAIPLSSQLESMTTRTNYVTAPSLDAAQRGGTETAPLLHSPDEPFLRLDASLSQLWTSRRGDRVFEISPYIRVLNSLGRRDALFYYFNRDDGQGTRAIGSLPIVPMVGVEWKL